MESRRTFMAPTRSAVFPRDAALAANNEKIVVRGEISNPQERSKQAPQIIPTIAAGMTSGSRSRPIEHFVLGNHVRDDSLLADLFRAGALQPQWPNRAVGCCSVRKSMTIPDQPNY